MSQGIEVHEGLFIGGQEVCTWTPSKIVLHAAKNPCHVNAVGYTGSLAKHHHEYLVARRARHLYLNLIDPPVPLFQPESFQAALDFLDEMLPQGPVTIHCNGGLSRAPSIALLWLAKRAKAIAGGSYDEARAEFLLRYDLYAPGKGIETYLRENWDSLR